MLIFGLILTLIGLLSGLFELGYYSITENCPKWMNNTFWYCSFIGITTLVIGIIVGTNMTKPPTALDVYQGKTTLQITYEDSIPVDSIVIYKPKFKK